MDQFHKFVFGIKLYIFLVFHRAYCTNLHLFELPTHAHCYSNIIKPHLVKNVLKVIHNSPTCFGCFFQPSSGSCVV